LIYLISPLDNTSCNFDRGLCDGWQQSYSDVFDWTINTGSTWSSDTGPDYDHTTGTGKKKNPDLLFVLFSSYIKRNCEICWEIEVTCALFPFNRKNILGN